MDIVFFPIVVLLFIADLISSSALSSTTTVSVAVDSTCNGVPSPTGPFEVCSSSAILTCCVLGCDEWVGHWYITSDNGTNEFVGAGVYLNVTLTRSWQRFLCAITSDNLDCYGDGFVILKTTGDTPAVSIAVNSLCEDDVFPRSFPVCSSPVILRCCVQGYDNYHEQWYRQTEAGEKHIKDGQELTVSFNGTQLNYSCDIIPFSFGCDSTSKGYVSLIKGSAPLLSSVNQTSNGIITVTEATHVIVYFKVATNGYLTKPPLLTLRGSNIMSRWLVTYYAATSTGIGEMIHNTTSVLTFYVRLEISKYSHQYDDGVYSIQAENECGQHTLEFTLKGTCDDSMPLQFVEKPPLYVYAVAGQDVTMHFKYNGIDIHNTWIVNQTYKLDDTQIVYNSSNLTVHCDEVYDFELIKVEYGGDFTIYSSRGADEIQRTIHLKILEVPHLYDTSPPRITLNTAMLQWTFIASCIHGGHLNELTWKKDGHYDVQDRRFVHSMHCFDDNSKVVYNLVIKNITTKDSGNYTSCLKYKYSIVHIDAMSTGSIFLNVSGTRHSHEPSGIELALISSLGAIITAVILSLVLLVGFLVRRNSPEPDPESTDDERSRLLPPRKMVPVTTFTTPTEPLEYSISTDGSPSSSLTSLDPIKINSLSTDSLNESSNVAQWILENKHKIACLLAKKDKITMVEGFRKKRLLNVDQENQFVLENDPRQCYLNVIDIVLNDPTKIEAFYCYMTEIDEQFQEHIASKVLVLYSIPGEQSFKSVLLPFTNLLRHRGINATSDFYEVDIADHQTWIQEHIAECIEIGGFVLVDISNCLVSDLRANEIELKMKHGQYTLDLTQLHGNNHFIPICLNKPAPSNIFQQKVYEINMAEFDRRYQVFSNNSSEVGEMISAVLNDAPESLQPLIELIRYIYTGV